MANKRLTIAQRRTLKELSMVVCILREYQANTTIRVRLYNYLYSSGIRKMTFGTLEVLVSRGLVKIDSQKSTKTNHYYFITEKGQQAINTHGNTKILLRNCKKG